MSDDVERTLYQGRPSLRGYAPGLALAGLASLVLLLVAAAGDSSGGTVGFLVVALGLAGVIVARVYTTTYQLTERRASSRSGILTREHSEVELIDVRNVQVHRDLVQRMVGVGNVGISTAGQGGVEVVFRGICEWERVAEIVRDQRRAPDGSNS